MAMPVPEVVRDATASTTPSMPYDPVRAGLMLPLLLRAWLAQQGGLLGGRRDPLVREAAGGPEATPAELMGAAGSMSPAALGQLRIIDPRLAGPVMQAKQLVRPEVWDYLNRHPTSVDVVPLSRQGAIADTIAAYPRRTGFPQHVRVGIEPKTPAPAVAEELVHAAERLARPAEEISQLAPGLKLPWISPQRLELMLRGYPRRDFPMETHARVLAGEGQWPQWTVRDPQAFEAWVQKTFPSLAGPGGP